MQAPNISGVLLEIAGCLGYLESFFATSITKMFSTETNNSHKSDSNSSRVQQDKVAVFEESWLELNFLQSRHLQNEILQEYRVDCPHVLEMMMGKWTNC